MLDQSGTRVPHLAPSKLRRQISRRPLHSDSSPSRLPQLARTITEHFFKRRIGPGDDAIPDLGNADQAALEHGFLLGEEALQISLPLFGLL